MIPYTPMSTKVDPDELTDMHAKMHLAFYWPTVTAATASKFYQLIATVHTTKSTLDAAKLLEHVCYNKEAFKQSIAKGQLILSLMSPPNITPPKSQDNPPSATSSPSIMLTQQLHQTPLNLPHLQCQCKILMKSNNPANQCLLSLLYVCWKDLMTPSLVFITQQDSHSPSLPYYQFTPMLICPGHTTIRSTIPQIDQPTTQSKFKH